MSVVLENKHALRALTKDEANMVAQTFYKLFALKGQFPYLGKVALSLKRYALNEGSGIETAAVDQFGRLMVYPEFFEGLSLQEREFVIMHELFHVMFRHGPRWLDNKTRDPKLWNYAGDMWINAMLPQLQIGEIPRDKDGKINALRGDAIGLTDAEVLDKTVEELYSLIVKYMQENKVCFVCNKPRRQKKDAPPKKKDPQDQNDDGSDDESDKKKDGQGNDGLGADGGPNPGGETLGNSSGPNGVPHPDATHGDLPDGDGEGDGESQDQSQDQGDGEGDGDGDSGQDGDGEGDHCHSDDGEFCECEGSGQTGQRGIGSGGCGSCAAAVEGPEGAAGEDGLSEAELESLLNKAAQDIQQQEQKSRGTIPAGLLRWAEQQLGTPQVRWQDLLKDQVKSAFTMRRGLGNFSFRRPRAYHPAAAYNYQRTGKRIIFPSMVKPEYRVGIIFDTSGSMGNAEIAALLIEIQGILQGCNISPDNCTILPVDAAVYPPMTMTEVLKTGTLPGGGGTDMCLGIRWFEDDTNYDFKQPEVVVCMTDSYTPWPEEEPPFGLVVGVIADEEEANAIKDTIPEWAEFVPIPTTNMRALVEANSN